MAGTLPESRDECGEEILMGNYKPRSHNLETGAAAMLVAGRAKIHPRDGTGLGLALGKSRLLACRPSQEVALVKGAVTVPSFAVLDIKVRA